MRRTRVVLLVAVMLVGSVVAWAGGAAAAQEATPVAETDHPLLGTWVLDAELEDPVNPLTLAVFSADGTYVQSAPSGEFESGSVVGAGYGKVPAHRRPT